MERSDTSIDYYVPAEETSTAVLEANTALLTVNSEETTDVYLSAINNETFTDNEAIDRMLMYWQDGLRPSNPLDPKYYSPRWVCFLVRASIDITYNDDAEECNIIHDLIEEDSFMDYARGNLEILQLLVSEDIISVENNEEEDKDISESSEHSEESESDSD
jgi:hypothetical protein